MRDDFTGRLRAGAADFAAAVRPAPPEAVRARGNRRRRRQALTAAVLALAIGAGGAGTAYASLGRQGLAAPATGRTPSATPAVTNGHGRPDIVAVTAKGALVVLDPLSGEARRILVRGGVAGGAVAVSPDGRTVYFAARHGCLGEIESVPVTGGRPRMITPGALPAVSPDGTKLAFARQPGTGAAGACHHPPADDQVVVRDLAAGGETVLPSAARQALRYPVSLLSWSPDSGRLLVSAGPGQDNEGWQLAGLDPATARYYLAGPASGASAVPLPGLAGSYYRAGVYMPDGDLFVNQVCCAGLQGRVTSSLLLEVSPSGQFVRQVGIGFKDRDHTSLSADPSGRWLLYLSGPDLFLSLEGAAPFKLTGGLTAAAWT
jgi:WD40 repeat protein